MGSGRYAAFNDLWDMRAKPAADMERMRAFYAWKGVVDSGVDPDAIRSLYRAYLDTFDEGRERYAQRLFDWLETMAGNRLFDGAEPHAQKGRGLAVETDPVTGRVVHVCEWDDRARRWAPAADMAAACARAEAAL